MNNMLDRVSLVFFMTLTPLLQEVGMAFPGAPRVGESVPDFRVQLLKEDTESPLTPADLKGQTVILEFWATWCVPCRAVRDRLIEIHKQYKDQGLRIVAVTDEDARTVRDYLAHHPVPFDVCLDPAGVLNQSFGIRGLPAAYLIDANGVVQWTGHPRTLYPATMKDFFQKHKAPKSFDLTTTQPAVRRAEPVLEIKISASREKLCSHLIKRTGDWSSPYLEVSLESETPAEIISLLKDVSSTRMVVSASVSNELYDIEYLRFSVNGEPQTTQPMIDALCREAALRVSEVAEEREVWVAIKQEPKLVRSEYKEGRRMGISPDERGRFECRRASLHEVFMSIESSYKVLIDDETGLTEWYDISWGSKDNFDAVRARLDREYGILLTKTRRPTRIVHVDTVEPESQTKQ